MPKISLSGAADLLTVIPFQLGFHPSRSVVVSCFHGKRIGLVARLDLPRDDPRGGSLREAVTEAVAVLLREKPSAVALVGFEDEAGEAGPLVDALSDAIEADRVIVRERVVVRDGRWFDLLRGCCPEEGHPVPDPSDVPAVASFVALGHAPLRGRDDLWQVFGPLARSDARHEPISSAIEQWQQRYVEAGGPGDRHGLPDGSGAVWSELDGGGDVGLGDGWDDGPVDGWDDGWDDWSVDGWEAWDDGWGDGGDAWDDGCGDDMSEDSSDDAERLAARERLVKETLEAWAGLLRGDLEGAALEDRLPAIVGPLRDPLVRGLILAWLRCDPALLDSWPTDPAQSLALLFDAASQPTVPVDPGVALPEGAQPGPGRSRASVHGHEPSAGAGRVRRPRRGKRKRGRRLRRASSGAAGQERVSVRPAASSTGSDLGWDDWGAAAAAQTIQARLEAACRLTPAPHAAPLLALVASYSWWGGDGARAGIAADRALEAEPDHALSLLIREALICGLRARTAVESS
ncbi:DUF4192 family protein [Monashia sp. NPDC004114]